MVAEKKCEAMIEGIRPVLGLIRPETEELAAFDQPSGTGDIVRDCQNTWWWFKQYMGDVAQRVASHVLAVVRSHYPDVDLMSRLEKGMADGTDKAKANQFRDSSMATATKLIKDIDLC